MGAGQLSIARLLPRPDPHRECARFACKARAQVLAASSRCSSLDIPLPRCCCCPCPQVVRGTVKQVAKYGVFVQLEGSPGVTGGAAPAANQLGVCLPSVCGRVAFCPL